MKCALVTGAGVGIGRGVALSLAKAGYDVAVHCNSSTERAEVVRREIEALGRRSVVLKADLTKPDEIDSLFEEYGKAFDRLDVFVANSGLLVKNFIEAAQVPDIDLMYNLNFRGTYFCIQGAAKRMREVGGSIIVISSNHFAMHHPLCSCYGSLKLALNKLVQYAALEFGKYRVRVNTIAPGWTDTGEPRLGEKEPTYYHIPLKRWCQPDEVGEAVLFLSGPYAGSITGACLTMDGGASLMSDGLEKYGYGEQ